jgi:hypothetical protein
MVKPSKRFKKDRSGQWWYHFGQKNPCRMRTQVVQCAGCGVEFVQNPIKRRDGQPVLHCSRTCGLKASYAKQKNSSGWKGEQSRHWKGGRRLDERGYVLVYQPGHHSIKYGARRYVLEHRLVMEQVLGRPLLEKERVHHKNGVRDDNRPGNLELWMNGHPPGQRAHERQHCPTCTCFAEKSAHGA